MSETVKTIEGIRCNIIQTVILSLKELVLAALGLGFLDLEQISIDEVTYVTLVESGLVLVDGLLKKIGHLLTVGTELCFNSLQPRKITEHRDIVDETETSKKLKTLINKIHETLEAIVTVLKTNAHYNRADDIRNGHSQGK
jgi:hypothetical protein